jgi:hypothetical protein
MKKKSSSKRYSYHSASAPEKIYVTRDSKGRFKDIQTTKQGRTLLTSPAKSKTASVSWRKAFSK